MVLRLDLPKCQFAGSRWSWHPEPRLRRIGHCHPISLLRHIQADLRPNGFTRESTFHDFPIRGQEVLLYVRRRRWLDTEEHNVMTECDFVPESTRCSKESEVFLKN